jgi:putative transposase
VSERRSCVALGVERSTIRYRSTKTDQAPLRLRIRDLAKTRVRYGYFRIYILLRREGWMINHKRVGLSGISCAAERLNMIRPLPG